MKAFTFVLALLIGSFVFQWFLDTPNYLEAISNTYFASSGALIWNFIFARKSQ